MLAVAFLIAFAVIGLIGVGYYTDQDLIKNNVDTVLSFTTDTDCNQVGDCITFQIPVTPENHETVPVDYDTDDITDATYYENGTAIAQESYITGNINDVSYSSSGVRQSSYLENENVMMVQLGNIISIDAQIKIIDPITKQIVEPRHASYRLILECSDLNEFCSVDPVTRRGDTNSVGTFNERITTNLQWTPALYEVTVWATSEQVDSLGIPYDVTNTLYVEVYK